MDYALTPRQDLRGRHTPFDGWAVPYVISQVSFIKRFFAVSEIEDMKKALIEAAGSLEERLTALSDDFYRNPETGMEEFRTSSSMQAFLREFGYDVEEGAGGLPTAFVASIGEGSPKVALLAEMDALPGIGHGCGHNISGAASVGAAAALATVLKSRSMPGSIVVIGTPAEELGSGKIELVKAGVFDGIDAAMMAHGSGRRLVAKHFLGMAELKFTFNGRAAHASAYPEDGINALDAVIQTFNSINALRQHFTQDVRVHGIITDGGRAPNIIPERAEAVFFVRAGDLDGLAYMKNKVTRCAEGAAAATGASLVVTPIGESNAPLKHNRALIDAYRGSLEYLGLVEDDHPPDKNMGSSDIGNVSQVVPAIHPQVPIRKGLTIHTREFADSTVTPDGHRALMEGVKALGLTALDLLSNPGLMKKIKEDFQKGSSRLV